MNAYELNKFIGAILAAFVFVMGLSVLSDIIFHEEALYEPAYAVAIAEQEEEMRSEEEEETPFAVLLASADPAAGESGARVCSACHTFEEGGANGIGPALHNSVGREIAGLEGFNYSAALVSYGEGKSWSYEELDGFLENPQGWVPGTIMGYAGIKDPEDRADVIAYMKSLSPDAPPLPEPPAAEETEVAAADPVATATDAAEPAGEVAAEAADAGGGSFAQLVAGSDPAQGEAAAAVCLACHSDEEGAPHKLGPNLHGVFGGPVAGAEGFAYSDAMTAHAEGVGEWGLQALSDYLEAPMDVVPGTKMAYAGVKDENERAAILAWLHSISPNAGPIAPEAGTQEAAVDPQTQSDAAPEDPATAAGELDATVDTDDAQSGSTAAPVEAGAGTEETAPATEAAPAEAAAAPASEAVVPSEGQPAAAEELGSPDETPADASDATPAEPAQTDTAAADPAATAGEGAATAPAAQPEAAQPEAAQPEAAQTPAAPAASGETDTAAAAPAAETAETAAAPAQDEAAAPEAAPAANVTIHDAPAANVEIVNPSRVQD